MQSNSFNHMLVMRVNREMPRVEYQIFVLTNHVRFLSKTDLDGRTLIEESNRAMAAAVELRHSLNSLAVAASSVTRRSLGEDFGQFQSNYRGNVRNITKNFDKLDVAIKNLVATASEKTNEPGRWGDAAMPSPIADLISLLGALMEIWKMERVRSKLNS